MQMLLDLGKIYFSKIHQFSLLGPETIKNTQKTCWQYVSGTVKNKYLLFKIPFEEKKGRGPHFNIVK